MLLGRRLNAPAEALPIGLSLGVLCQKIDQPPHPGNHPAPARKHRMHHAAAWLSEDGARAYEVAGRLDLSWRGLARYWKRRAA